MKTGENTQNQYWTLLIISVATALLIPLAYNITSYTYSASMPESALNALKFFHGISIISMSFSTAALIFASFRYRFRLCLPFAAIKILYYLLTFVSSTFLSKIDLIKLPSSVLIDSTSSYAVAIAVIFAEVGIAKLFAKLASREIAAVSFTLSAMLIGSLLLRLSYAAIFYKSLVNPLAIEVGNVASSILHSVLRAVPQLLLNYLYIAVSYFILFIIFSRHRQISVLLSKVKPTLKKLWDATAK